MKEVSITVNYGEATIVTNSIDVLKGLLAEGIAKYGEIHVMADPATDTLCGRHVLPDTIFTVALDVLQGEADLFEGVPVCPACLRQVPQR